MEREVLETLLARDVETAKRLLSQVHREKAFALTDLEVGVEADVALYHAYHVALLSLIQGEVDVDPASVTGLDYALSRKFAEAIERCGQVEGQFDDFFTKVVAHLNRLLESLCR